MRPLFGIVFGLGIGIAGTLLFLQSLPPKTGSDAERADQVAVYEKHRRERWANAQRELDEVGLALPEDWDLFDVDDF